jgi:hypothetical protein
MDERPKNFEAAREILAAAQIARDNSDEWSWACACIGGMPLCHCRMRVIDDDIAALHAAGYDIVKRD